MPQQNWATAADGGRLGTTHLTKMLRQAAQPLLRFRQLVEPFPEGIGKGRGDTLLFNKVGNVATAGGSLAETSTIPATKAAIQQGSVVMTEFGNSVPFTSKLSTLSEYDVEAMVKQVLANDMAKTLETQAGGQHTSGKIKAVCTSTTSTVFTSDGTFTATASANAGRANVMDIVDDMRRRNTPPFDAQGNYLCVATVNFLRGVRADLESFMQYTESGVEGLKGSGLYPYRGEVGRFYDCRFVLVNHFLKNTVGSGANKGEAVFIGADAVREYAAIPEEMRTKIPTDFGRDEGMAWYYLGNFVRVWDQTNDSEDHLVHVGSA